VLCLLISPVQLSSAATQPVNQETKKDLTFPDQFLSVGILQSATENDEEKAKIILSVSAVVAELERALPRADLSFNVIWNQNNVEKLRLFEQAKKANPGAAKEWLEQPGPSINPPITNIQMRMRWAFDGVKYRMSFRTISLVKQFDFKDYDASYDGEYTFAYYPEGKNIKIRQEGYIHSDISEPLTSNDVAQLILCYIDNKPVSNWLKQPGIIYRGKQKVGDSDCLLFSRYLQGEQDDLWLSITNMYRVKCYRQYLLNKDNNPIMLSSSEILSYTKIGDVIFYSGGKNYRLDLDDNNKIIWNNTFIWSLVDSTLRVIHSTFSVDPTQENVLFPSKIFPIGTFVQDFSGQFYSARTAQPDMEENKGGE
jgi:hypothetical protein